MYVGWYWCSIEVLGSVTHVTEGTVPYQYRAGYAFLTISSTLGKPPEKIF